MSSLSNRGYGFNIIWRFFGSAANRLPKPEFLIISVIINTTVPINLAFLHFASDSRVGATETALSYVIAIRWDCARTKTKKNRFFRVSLRWKRSTSSTDGVNQLANCHNMNREYSMIFRIYAEREGYFWQCYVSW